MHCLCTWSHFSSLAHLIIEPCGVHALIESCSQKHHGSTLEISALQRRPCRTTTFSRVMDSPDSAWTCLIVHPSRPLARRHDSKSPLPSRAADRIFFRAPPRTGIEPFENKAATP